MHTGDLRRLGQGEQAVVGLPIERDDHRPVRSSKGLRRSRTGVRE
jgi:hypothetical protein